MNIGFIGIGNMGKSILQGFLPSKEKDDKVFICGRNKERARILADELKIESVEEISKLVEISDIIFLGVKPYDLEGVLLEISNNFNREELQKKTFVSMAAGISMNFIYKYLEKCSLIRIMPNTPSKIGKGTTSISYGEFISSDMAEKVVNILKGIGMVVEVKEEYIHSVIGASGSSPAYTYMYIDALIKEVVKDGLDYDIAKKLVCNSVIGSAYMVMLEDEDIDTLVDRVCSKGGTTIEAVNYLNNNDFSKMVQEGVRAAISKSKLLEK